MVWGFSAAEPMQRIVMPVERKYERDIDLLLAEEFSVNPAFAGWFVSLTKFAGRTAEVVEVHVSKADTQGESDLVVVFAEPSGHRFAILIEDKLDAPLQPDQAARYHRRALKEVELGTCGDFEIVLCAPRHYLDGHPGLEGFEVRIPHEEIGAKLAEIDPSPRGQYRGALVGTAANKRINSWKPERDQETDAFWEAAYRIATKDFPILELKQPKVTKGSTWIDLRPRDMPTMPKRTIVSLKGDRGLMDLAFANTTAHVFGEKAKHLLEDDMSIHQTSASAAIRLEVAGFQVTEGDDGLHKVREAFKACARLIEFYRKNRSDLDVAAQVSTPN